MIKLLVMDVDGTLTDGSIFMGPNGEAMKRFNCKDGYGIQHIVRAIGITPAIITGRTSQILVERCKELHITQLVQDCQDKVSALSEMLKELHCDWTEVAYIGDDLNDLAVMKKVGVRGCPSDAVKGIKEICEYVCVAEGGRGAVREFIEWIRDEYAGTVE